LPVPAIQEAIRPSAAGDLACGLGDGLDVPAVVVTPGGPGCVACSAGTSRRYLARRAVSVDATGTGDAFAASLAAFPLTGAAAAGDATCPALRDNRQQMAARRGSRRQWQGERAAGPGDGVVDDIGCRRVPGCEGGDYQHVPGA
jgi:sugar/nucleoside kinase (ribokinase family)